MKMLVGVMGFSILICAVLTLHDPLPALHGPAGADDSRRQRHLRAVDHRRHRRLDHDAVLQLLDARGEACAAPAALGYVRGDIAIAYLFTAIFGISIMLIANQAFFIAGRDASPTRRRCRRWRRCSARMLGPFGVYRVLGRLLGGGVRVAARRVAERAVSLRRLLRHRRRSCRRAAREELTKVTSTPYRLALALHHAGAAAVRLHRPAARSSSSPTRSSAACSCRSSPRRCSI